MWYVHTEYYVAIKIKGEQAFSLPAKTLCPILDYLGSRPSSDSSLQFPADADPERQQLAIKYLGSCHTCGRPKLCSQLLVPALAQLQPLQAFGK